MTSARTRRRKREDLTGVLLLSGTAIIAASVVAGAAWLYRKQPNLDANSLCPEGGAQGLTVLLVDQTEPLNAVQQEALRVKLLDIENEIHRGAGLEIYSIQPVETAVLKPELPLICNPGRGADVDAITGNPRLVERRWHDAFDLPVRRLLSQLTAPATRDVSPIFESIQSVSVTALSTRVAGAKRLIIASDMLQNTANFSQYRTPISFAELSTTDYYRRVRADLRGIDVEVIYIRRDGPYQPVQHIQFWQEYFAEAGGHLQRVIALVG